MDRRSFLRGMFSAGIAAPVAMITSQLTRASSQGEGAASRPVADEALRKRRIRCGYIVAPPYISRDPNTGRMSGLFYDLTQKIGELADCEIVWEAETTYATYADDLNAGKYDLFAGGLWANANRAKVADFSRPVFYSGVGLYVRADDHRFDGRVSLLNAPAYRVATMDGELSQAIRLSDFPLASALELPESADLALLVESVLDGKADATFLQKSVANLYEREHGPKLRDVTAGAPLRLFANVWSLAYGSIRLKGVLDAAIAEMSDRGHVEQVLARYERDGRKDYDRLALPVR